MLTPFLKMPAVTTIFGDGSGVPQPVPATLAVEEPDQEYVELSKRLRVNKIPLQLIELARVIREVCIGVYRIRRRDPILGRASRTKKKEPLRLH